MRLGTLADLQDALGGGVGRGYASALKQAAGMVGCRRFDVDAVVKWRREHPNWKMTDPRPQCNQTGLQGEVVGKSGAR